MTRTVGDGLFLGLLKCNVFTLEVLTLPESDVLMVRAILERHTYNGAHAHRPAIILAVAAIVDANVNDLTAPPGHTERMIRELDRLPVHAPRCSNEITSG